MGKFKDEILSWNLRYDFYAESWYFMLHHLGITSEYIRWKNQLALYDAHHQEIWETLVACKEKCEIAPLDCPHQIKHIKDDFKKFMLDWYVYTIVYNSLHNK